MPKVIGSAWTPWVRPTMTVRRCSSARRFRTSRIPSTRCRIRSAERTRRVASAVSTTSELVSPKWIQRPSAPTCSAMDWVKATTSCWTVFSISWMRAMSKPARSRMATAASSGTIPSAAIASAAATSTSIQEAKSASSVQIAPISGRT